MSVLSRRSILWQLVAALLITHLLVSAITGWFAFRQVRDFHRQSTINELHRLTPIIEDIYSQWLTAVDAPTDAGLHRAVETHGLETGLRITIVQRDGTVLADSHANFEVMDNHRNRPEVADALEQGLGHSVRRSNSTGLWTVYAARASRIGSNVFVVRAARPLSEVEAEAGTLWKTIGLASGASFLLLSGVLTIVFRRLAHEARQLAETAAHYASGELDYRSPHLTSAELSRLGRSLEDMAKQLNGQMTQLRAQQAEQQAILQSMSNGVIAVDLEERILNMNAAAERLLGIESKTVRGRLLQEAVRQSDLHQFVTAAFASGTSRSAEFKLHGNPPITVQVNSETLRDPNGHPKGLLIILNDVTRLRRLEALRSDFAANVSHELRTPITNIKGYVETLLEVGFVDPEQARKFLEIVRKNSNRLASIVEDVLSLTRLEQPQSREQIERVPTRILPVLRAAVGQFEEAAHAKEITVTIESQQELTIAAHPQLLEQAIGNLLSNAINYSPPNTRVQVKARLINDEQVEISVTDQGPGIAREHLPRLFERFYRVDKGRSRELGGTGLGLALVKHIALVHGGSVSVESQLNSGSTFRMTLPRTATQRT